MLYVFVAVYSKDVVCFMIKAVTKKIRGVNSRLLKVCRDKERKGFHMLVFQTEAGFLDRQQESIKEFYATGVHVKIAVLKKYE
ncbi:hypothetical protein Tco_0843215 [Tanacetum coccineum]|uniref:Uncharacterized protein n=1 Tax=Tanacetum coccineum TaxID=301880 RepID=A0ABQ5B2P2_9ASTR